jgi:hypothetical protein
MTVLMEKTEDQGSGASTPRTIQTPVRPNTPEFIRASERLGAMPRVNPFDTPFNSRPTSTIAASSGLQQSVTGLRYFHSRRVRKGEVEKPWLKKRDPREKWVTIIPVIGLVVGLIITGFLVYDGLKSVVNHKYCAVLDDDFSSGFNGKFWTKEAQVGGFG